MSGEDRVPVYIPKRLYERVSEFIGSPNILQCSSCSPLGNGLTEVRCKDIKLIIPYHGEVRKIAISPRDVYISRERPPGPDVNRLRGEVMEVSQVRGIHRIKVRVGGEELLAELPSEIGEELDIKGGEEVFLILKFRGLRVLPA